MAKTPVVFSDIDLRFEKNPLTRDIARKNNDEAIKNSLRNLIMTSFYERPFNSALGSPIRSMLFEPITPMLGVVIKKSIEQVITNFEPRVDLSQVLVTAQPDNNSLQVTIEYTILGTQAIKTFSLILERTR